MNLDKQLRRLERKLEKIAKDATPKAFAAASNKLATQSKTAVASEVAKEVRIPVRAVKGRIFIRRARPGAMVAKVVLYARPVDAINTSPSRMAKGWKVAGQFRERSFMQRMPNMSRHRIFQRTGNFKQNERGWKIEQFRKVNVNIDEEVARIGKAVTTLKVRKDFARLYQHELNARIKGYVTRGR